MIVLTNGTGRIFIPDGEAGQVPGLLADGYWEWGKEAEPKAEPEPQGVAKAEAEPEPVADVFSAHASREEIASEPPAAQLADPGRVDWTAVSGVSDEIANALYYVGLTSKATLMAYGEGELTKIPGIGKKRARDLVKFAERGY